MTSNKRLQCNREEYFSSKQPTDQIKAIEWFQTTCQFQCELEGMIRDSLFTLTASDSDTRLLRCFIDERNTIRELHAKEDLSGVFFSIMKAQPFAVEIIERVKSGSIDFTIVEGA